MKAFFIFVVAALVGGSSGADVSMSNVIRPNCKGILYGRAVRKDGPVVPGLGLELYPLGNYASFVAPTTRTNEVGEYRFDHVCLGRFNVVVDDERTGYPPSLLIRLMSRNPAVELTIQNPERELVVNVPLKAALLVVSARNTRTQAILPSVQIALRTSKYKMYDWVTIDRNSNEPLLIPADTDLLCRVSAKGYREWRGGKRKGKPIRLPSEGKLNLDVELAPR